MPIRTYSQTFGTMSLTASRPLAMRSSQASFPDSSSLPWNCICQTKSSTHLLQPQPTDEQARDDRNGHAGGDVKYGHLPAEHTIEQNQRHLVDDRCGDTRKEKVTPNGMPVSTKPMKSGTALQEQNGVTIPSAEASTLPMPTRLPLNNCCARSALKKVRSTVIAKIIPASSNRILGTS